MDEDEAGLALGELQLDVMRVLWERGEESVAGVAAALAADRPLAHTTVATVLTRLARRGVVAARREGRLLLYRAAASESQVRRGMVAGLVRRLFRGDAGALVAHLVNEREVAAGDLARVQALLDEAAADGESPAGTKGADDAAQR
jgi:predicted transcriptional regulator